VLDIEAIDNNGYDIAHYIKKRKVKKQAKSID
jgi:hypothetical protein